MCTPTQLVTPKNVLFYTCATLALCATGSDVRCRVAKSCRGAKRPQQVVTNRINNKTKWDRFPLAVSFSSIDSFSGKWRDGKVRIGNLFNTLVINFYARSMLFIYKLKLIKIANKWFAMFDYTCGRAAEDIGGLFNGNPTCKSLHIVIWGNEGRHVVEVNDCLKREWGEGGGEEKLGTWLRAEHSDSLRWRSKYHWSCVHDSTRRRWRRWRARWPGGRRLNHILFYLELSLSLQQACTHARTHTLHTLLSSPDVVINLKKNY